MDATQQLGAALLALCDLVDSLWHTQLEHRTPSGATVEEVLDALIERGATYTYWLRGQDAPEIVAPPVYGWVPAAELREVMDDLLVAASSPGALDRSIRTQGGRTCGAEFVQLLASGALLRALDLAAATGKRFDLPTELRVAFDPFARAVA